MIVHGKPTVVHATWWETCVNHWWYTLPNEKDMCEPLGEHADMNPISKIERW